MTNCPPDIADILLEILETGLLRIRIMGWNAQADGCAREADHLHNLPRLLADYRPQVLLYYWDVERAGYIEEAPPEGLAAWEPLRRRLEPHVAAIRSSIRLP
jgi:hypothetical protein